MIDIATTYTPIRHKLSTKEPVNLKVVLHNKGKESRMISMELRLNRNLSLDKSGFRGSDVKRLEKFGKGEKKEFYYEIWPKQSTSPGEQPVEIVVAEHYNNFNYVEKEQRKSIPLTVE